MPHKQGLKNVIEQFFGKDREVRGIEIGCFKGELPLFILSNLMNVSLISIDPCLYWDAVIKNTKNYANRFQIISLASNKAVSLVDGRIDFVFIDGDHSYQQCREDILNYLPLISKDGFISGHNYHKAESSAHPGVHQAVDEIFKDKVKLEEDFIWYVQVKR